jgi:hypothetical protein
MNNYFRITAYYPQEDFSAIFDSFGLYEKLWQFSAFLVSKGFKIIDVRSLSESNGSIDANCLTLAEPEPKRILLRACGKGLPIISNGIVEVNGIRYLIP